MAISEKIVQELSSFDIIGNTETSDTIVLYDTTTFSSTTTYYNYRKKRYINIQSGACSVDFGDVIREGMDYIYLSDMQKGGWVAEYIPKYDVLLVVYYYLEHKELPEESFSWNELSRVIIGRNDAILVDGDKVSCFDKSIMDCYSPDFDYAVDLYGRHITDTSSLSADIAGVNVSGRSGEQIRRFVKGVWWLNNEPVMFNDNTCKAHLLAFFVHTHYKDMSFGIKETGMEGISVKGITIPNYHMRLLKDYEHRIIDSCFLFNGDEYYFLKGMKYGYLQNCNGEYVLRIFISSVKKFSEGNIDLYHLEMKRVHICAETLTKMEDISIPLLYFDREGIHDGRFRYVIKYLEEAEDRTISRLCFINHHWIPLCPDECNMNFATAIAFMPLFEKLINTLISKGIKPDFDCNNFAVSLRELAERCRGSFAESMICHMGHLSFEKKELHQCLEVPKQVINMVITDRYFPYYISVLKFLFKRHEDYFMGMDEKSLENIIGFLKAHSCHDFLCYPVICLSRLICIFGPYNVNNYCSFLSEVIGSNDDKLKATYEHYLEKLMVIKNVTGDLEWRLKGEELEKADNSILKAYLTLSDKKFYNEAAGKFQLQFKDWERYKYSSGEFFITYPTGPCELVEEGIKLNHCVKDFIEKVSEGLTTILFIRKNEKPLSPFYTLEVRNGYIRQCHGFNNCNVNKHEGLGEFINEFCSKKNVKIYGNDINSLLPPED